MKSLSKKALLILKETYAKWNEHEAPRLGASLAFYSVLSLPPLLILTATIIGLVLGQTHAEAKLVDQARSLVGTEGGSAIQSLLTNSHKPSQGGIASLIALVTLLLGASGVLGELQAALNKVWETPASAQGGLWTMIRKRFFTFGMVLAIGFLLLISLVLSAGLAMMSEYFGQLLPIPAVVASALNFLISLIAISILLALLFRYVPDVRTDWKDLWIGAGLTSLLFSIGKVLIGLYLGHAAVASAYGAAGSLIAVVVWIYYSAQILFFGAEFTHVVSTAGETPTG